MLGASLAGSANGGGSRGERCRWLGGDAKIDGVDAISLCGGVSRVVGTGGLLGRHAGAGWSAIAVQAGQREGIRDAVRAAGGDAAAVSSGSRRADGGSVG